VNARAEASPPQSRVPIVLGTALAVVLVLLVWSYLALGSRIDELTGEAQVLRAAVAERDELINAQRARLDEVRSRIQELLQLVEQPVAGVLPVVPDEPPVQAPESP
jgi:type VI protein secretion system component VasK